ncbi:hypothetical protein TWF696_007667 [Orbilia brochopaga]|uniref:DEK-C domain-containing protein n=1 Tax=Orbilia brochopaga TaxID=3140254 RepID=A0AAV9UP95_9PEZI
MCMTSALSLCKHNWKRTGQTQRLQLHLLPILQRNTRRLVAGDITKLSPALTFSALSRSFCRAAASGRAPSVCFRSFGTDCYSAAASHYYSSSSGPAKSQLQLSYCYSAKATPRNTILRPSACIFLRSFATRKTGTITTKSKKASEVSNISDEPTMEFDPVLYTPIIDKILRGSDLASITSKDVRRLLQEELGYDIPFEQKEDTRDLIKARFDLILDEKGAENVQPVKKEPKSRDKDVKKEDPGSSPSKKRKSVASPSLDDDARLAAKLQAEWNSQDRPSRSAAAKRKVVAPRKKKKSSATVSDGSGAEEGGEKKKRKINPNNPFHVRGLEGVEMTSLCRAEC